jgi:PST family polysaccharide transporter
VSTAESEQQHAALFEKRLFAGGRSLLASQAIRLGLRVASTVMLARMLNPTDYGIFGMAVVVYGLFYAIRDVGLSTVTVSRHAVTDDEISALFWINVAVGAILTALFCGLGPAFAAIDSEPRLKAMFPALGACYLINALGAQPQAVLSREMRFVTLSAIEVVSMAGGLAVALGAAWAGAGYWALVCMVISAEVVRLAGLWWACPWRPGPWPGWTGLRELLGLGARLTGFNTLNYLAGTTDQFLVGAWMGSTPLGLYGRASQFTSLPAQYLMTPLNAWMVAALSRLKLEPGRYASLNRQVMNAVAQVVFPLATGLIAAPAPIITFALGAKWAGGAGALRWLAVGLLAQPLLFAQNWLMLSQGHGGRLCALATANLAALLALCAAMRAHGIEGIACATAFAAIAVSLPGIYWATRQSPVALRGAAGALRRPFLLAIAFGAALGGTLRALGTASNGHTLIALLAAIAVWASLALAWRSARREWLEAVRAFGMASGKLSA